MVKNTNDGSQREPYIRLDINSGNLFGLPPYSTAPTGDERAILQAAKAAGFMGVQGAKGNLCRELGLGVTGSGRVDKIGDADKVATRNLDEGAECATVHVGRGREDDAEVFALVEDMLKVSEQRKLPLYIETHRATITQDMWRTVQIVKKFPEVRFNGDFSHWYTGQQMVYGGFENNVAFAAPVFERVRFIHGRIGNPGSIQVDIGDGVGRTYVDHFKEMWIRCFAGFLKSAQPGDYICFAPELLPPFYARLVKNAQGEEVEECDRWQQALLYKNIAAECFEKAKQSVKA